MLGFQTGVYGRCEGMGRAAARELWHTAGNAAVLILAKELPVLLVT